MVRNIPILLLMAEPRNCQKVAATSELEKPKPTEDTPGLVCKLSYRFCPRGTILT